MTRLQIKAVLRSALEEVAEEPLGELDEASTLADIEIDSLEIVEAVTSIERSLNVKLPNESLANLRTVGELLDVIGQQVS